MFSVTAQSAVPTTVGIGLADGELDFEPRSTSDGNAVVVTRRYESGNPLHVVAIGVFEPGRDITLSPDIAEGIAPEIGAVSASVVLGNEIADLADADLHENVFSTPTMREAVYRVALLAGVDVAFYVRRYSDGTAWVRAVVERPDTYRGASKDTTGLTDHMIVKLHGVTVYSGSFTLYRNAGASWSRYAGTDQHEHTITHDTHRLQRTGLVPRMGWLRNVSESRLESLPVDYEPGKLLGYKSGMAAGGVTAELGAVPRWGACWLATGDERAWQSILDTTLSAAAYAIAWRNAHGHVLKPSDSPDIAYNGLNGGGTNTFENGPYQFDGAHNPEIGYLAYLMTGDTYYRDIMLGNVAALYMLSKVDGTGVNKLSRDQVRQTAWIVRAIGNAAQILPDDHPSLPDLRAWLWTQYAAALAAGPDNEEAADSTLGIPWVKCGNAADKVIAKPWMDNFWTWAIAYVARTDALRGERKAEAQRLARWMLQSIVGQLQGYNGQCPAFGAEYSLEYSDRPVRYWGQWEKADYLYRSWPELFAANGVSDCPSDLQGNGSTGPLDGNSHWAQMMPAVAEAFEYSVPGIAEAWDTVRRAGNYKAALYDKDWSWGGWGEAAEQQPIEPLDAIQPPQQPEVTSMPSVSDDFIYTPINGIATDLPEFPLNKIVQLAGVTPTTIKQAYTDAGFQWSTKAYSQGRVNGLFIQMQSAWCGHAHDPGEKELHSGVIGGHLDGSVNGNHVFNYASGSIRIDKLPADPDAPGLEWSQDYRRYGGAGGTYGNYTPPGEFSDMLPDGSMGAEHTYGSVVYDQHTKALRFFRGAHWTLNTARHATEPGRWTRHENIKRTDGTDHWSDTYQHLFWDATNRVVVGSNPVKYAPLTWGEYDPATNVWTSKWVGADLDAGICHACEMGEHEIIVKSMRRNNSAAEAYNIWDKRTRAFRWSTAQPVINPINYADGISQTWNISVWNEMTSMVYVDDWGLALIRTNGGGNRNKWWTFNPETGEQLPFTPEGYPMPFADRVGNKWVYDRAMHMLVFVNPVSETGSMYYLMRTGEMTDPVEPPIDPVDPPTDPVDPPADPVDPPVEPPTLEETVADHEARITAIEQTLQEMSAAIEGNSGV